jgi:carbon storage regulator CsrA
MLVLSRKRQQSVVVGGPDSSERGLKVTVLEIGRGQVRLGFEAEGGLRVHRWEVWERIRAGTLPNAQPGGAVLPGAG